MGSRERLREVTPTRVWEAAHAARAGWRRIGYRRTRWPRPLGTRPPIGLAVCAIFRNEARYLAEWVSFHRVQGVERFYLYDNLSEDDWRSELEPEIEAGIVEVEQWPYVQAQRAAYENCLQQHRDEPRWLAFIDIDEFLFSPTGKPLPEVLRSFDTHPGVMVNWRIYGTSGWKQPPEGLVVENYLWRAPDDFPRNRWMKAIVYPRTALGSRSVHHFQLQDDPVDEDGHPSPWGMRRSVSANLLRINHYFTRSEEEFRRKIRTPSADPADIKRPESKIPVDAVRDETILQFSPQLRTVLASRHRT